jgi:hypothetical protein
MTRPHISSANDEPDGHRVADEEEIDRAHGFHGTVEDE